MDDIIEKEKRLPKVLIGIGIIELLIGIGIVAVIISLYFKVGQPIVVQQNEQNVDEKRIADLEKLNEYVRQLAEVGAKQSVSKLVYISLPSQSENCTDQNLPELAEGWAYHCQSKDNYQKTNGLGWMPKDFTQIKDKKALETLPVDPLNNENFYYAYIQNDGNVLTAALATPKYLKEKAQNDKGTDLARYELGTNLNLWAQAQGLVGYWPFDEGSGVISADNSGNNNSASLLKESWLNIANCQISKCVNVDKNNNSISIPKVYSFAQHLTGTYSLWFKIAQMPSENFSIFVPGTNRLDFNIEGKTGYLFVWFADKNKEQNLVFKAKNDSFVDNKWHLVTVSKTSAQIEVYLDTVSVAKFKTLLNTFADEDRMVIGETKNFQGEFPTIAIDDLRVYNRALSQGEIEQIYNAAK